MAVKPTTPAPSKSASPAPHKVVPPPPPPTQSARPQIVAAVASAPIIVPPPAKIPLEETVRKAVEARKGTLVNALDTEHKAQVIREEEVRKGREKIDALTAEIADMDAFLARN